MWRLRESSQDESLKGIVAERKEDTYKVTVEGRASFIQVDLKTGG